MKKSGLIQGILSLEGDNLVVVWYLSASEIWPDKRGGGGGYKKEALLLKGTV